LAYNRWVGVGAEACSPLWIVAFNRSPQPDPPGLECLFKRQPTQLLVRYDLAYQSFMLAEQPVEAFWTACLRRSIQGGFGVQAGATFFYSFHSDTSSLRCPY
jgi:hypothetical protein